MAISILIPTYNSTRYLRSTLESVSAQQRKPDEVLIIDDQSTDGTIALCEEWAAKQTFAVRILQNRFPHDGKPGPAGGRQTGLLEAKSDLIGLLDHDDEMLPCHLQVTEQAMLQHPELSLCFADALEFEEGNQREWSLFQGKTIELASYVEREPLGLRFMTDPLLPTLIHGSYIPTAANLWRREAALQAGGFRTFAGTCDDVLFFLTLSRFGATAYYPFPIARKRTHNGNLSATKYALRHCWNYWEALAYVISEPSRWDLSRGEAILVRERVEELREEILYHASREGLSKYLDARKKLGPSPRSESVYGAVRAMLRSTRLMFAKPG